MMNKQEKTRERLLCILEKVHCSGLDYPRKGSCFALSESLCYGIARLDLCMIKAIVEALIAEGVTFPEDPADEI